MMESHCKEKKVESDEKVKRKPGRPRKHNVRPVVKDVPIGNDFNKATITTKTFTIKVENFDQILIFGEIKYQYLMYSMMI